MLYQFYIQVNGDLSKYDFDDAWPVVLDEFVAWQKEKERENPAQSDDSDIMEITG